MLKKTLTILLTLALTLSFASCTKKAESTKPDTENDVLTVVISNDISTLDPHDTTTFPHHQVTRQIYETLVVRDENGELIPWLAESWEYENDVTILMKLRQGVKFHNGEEMKASDVLFSLRRMLDDNTTAAMQVSHLVLDKCEEIDEYTVRIVTDEPSAMQLAMLENPLACIISEKSYNESNGDFFKAPVGTGPYKFVSYDAGDKVELTANEEYWVKDEPHIPNIVFRIITDSSSRAIEAESGNADIVYDIGANDVDRISANPNINLVRGLGMNTSYITFNTAKKPLDDIRVREAIWYAVDLDQIVDIAYGTFGAKADGIVSPGVEGRHPDLSSYFVARDVEKARALLAEAGYANGITLRMTAPNADQQRMDVCEAMQAQLAEVGITLDLDYKEYNAWISEITNGAAELGIYGFTASTGEAGRVLMRWMPDYSESVIFSWYDDEYITKCGEAMKTIDDDTRNKLFAECQELLMESRCAMPIWHKELNAALQPNVKGFTLQTSYEQHYLQTVYFE